MFWARGSLARDNTIYCVYPHLKLGLHWLMYLASYIYPNYAKVLNTTLAFAVFLPKFTIVGHVAAGNRILELA